MPEDRLILDRDIESERERLGIGNNPVDIEEIRKFTLEADLERLSYQLKEQQSRVDQEQSVLIKKRMSQAVEERNKLSERGIEAFDYLESRKEDWNR